MRDDNDFADVTLACEDGQQVEAHKAVLAASSPFFQKLFGRRNKNAHSIIYMRGVKSDDLLAIVDFLYRGEANVFQENLDSFLAIAEELQLKGLMGKTDQNVENTNVEQKYVPAIKMPIHDTRADIQKRSYDGQTPSRKFSEEESDRTVAVSSNFSGNLDELDERVKSMMGKSQNNLPNGQKASVCKVCGKEDKNQNIKDHIEANHLEGISLPCSQCEKTFRSRMGLRKHRMRQHRTD